MPKHGKSQEAPRRRSRGRRIWSSRRLKRKLVLLGLFLGGSVAAGISSVHLAEISSRKYRKAKRMFGMYSAVEEELARLPPKKAAALRRVLWRAQEISREKRGRDIWDESDRQVERTLEEPKGKRTDWATVDLKGAGFTDREIEHYWKRFRQIREEHR